METENVAFIFAETADKFHLPKLFSMSASLSQYEGRMSLLKKPNKEQVLRS